MNINGEQRLVIDAGAGFWSCFAGPGSGKTFCFVERYKRIAAEYGMTNILSLTFTREAAKEMAKRAGAPEHGPIESVTPFGFRTFHSLALSFAVQERESFGFPLEEFPLAVEGQAAKFAGEVGRRFSIDYRKLTERVSAWKREGTRPDAALKESEASGNDIPFALAYGEYEAKLRSAGMLDFDGLMMEMVDVLQRNPIVRDRWSPQWIQTDESQDNDKQQFELLRLLSLKHGNLLCVGDAGQAIYQWRGSHPELFLKMGETFPGTRTLYLAKNHRSTQIIVDLLRKIGPVRELAEKFHTENATGPAIQVLVSPDAVVEASRLATVGTQMLTKAHRFEGSVCIDCGTFYGEYGCNPKGKKGKDETVAILARTNRALRPIEEALSERGTPYHLIGNAGFWSQPEIRSVLAYLQMVVGTTDNALMGAIRAPFWPSRGVMKTVLTQYLRDTQSGDPNKPSLWTLLVEYGEHHGKVGALVNNLRQVRYQGQAGAKDAVANVLRWLKAVEYYQDEEESPDNDPVANLQDLERIAARHKTLEDFLDFVRKAQNASRAKKGVALATIHAAKGLQWATVLVAGCTEGLIPHEKGDLGEEGRLFFVAASRPENRLYLSYYGEPSRFLVDAGLVRSARSGVVDELPITTAADSAP